MQSETKTCQNCKQNFVIEPEDFLFYEKIKVPAPTWCPECRFQRRLIFFNLTTLYRRACDLCKKDFISEYASDSPYVVYCPPCWWSDGWDSYHYGQDYDFSKPFFTQLGELMRKIPRLGLELEYNTSINSSYNNHAGGLKNCYLLFQADSDEDCAYGVIVKKCKSLLDCSLILESELCFDSMHSYKNSRCIGLRSQVTESIDCAFLKDSFNCQNCFASTNLRNKKYYIFNKPYTKEKYFEEMKKWDLGSYAVYQEAKKRAEEHWKNYFPKPNKDDFSVASTGNSYYQTKNCKSCFEVVGAEDSKYLFMLYQPPIKDCYDLSAWGDNVSMIYESCMSGGEAAYLKFCYDVGLGLHDAEYSSLAFGGAHLFASVGVKNGEYIIFNKRYTKEKYAELREKIITHMNEMPYTDNYGHIYRYGEFFPPELTPFPYNDTLAQRFFPLSIEEAVRNGFSWRNAEEHGHPITKKVADLPDHIKDTPDSIIQEVIECAECLKGFKIIPSELEFLRRMNVPLPRCCPFCRIDEKFSQWIKNLRMVKRICDGCGVSFITSYPEDEVPHILCKKCYQAQVI